MIKSEKGKTLTISRNKTNVFHGYYYKLISYLGLRDLQHSLLLFSTSLSLPVIADFLRALSALLQVKLSQTLTFIISYSSHKMIPSTLSPLHLFVVSLSHAIDGLLENASGTYSLLLSEESILSVADISPNVSLTDSATVQTKMVLPEASDVSVICCF